MSAPVLPVFLALWPSGEARGRLHELATPARAGVGRAVAASDLHLTLLYLGPLAAGERRAVVRALEGFRFPAFRLVLDRLGAFRDARALWAGPRIVPPPLALLAALLAALDLPRGASGPAESRPFRPHVTLVRGVRTGQDGDLDPPLLWPVRNLVLAARSPRRGGAYRLLARWRLGAEAGSGGGA